RRRSRELCRVQGACADSDVTEAEVILRRTAAAEVCSIIADQMNVDVALDSPSLIGAEDLILPIGRLVEILAEKAEKRAAHPADLGSLRRKAQAQVTWIGPGIPKRRGIQKLAIFQSLHGEQRFSCHVLPPQR